VTVHYYQNKANVFQLGVQLFSILGGIFMIAKLIDSYISCCFGPPKKKNDDVEFADGFELGGV